MDQLIPELGFSAQDAANELAGMKPIPLELSAPWWSVSSTAASQPVLTVQLTSLGTARKQPDFIELDVTVQLREGAGGIAFEAPGALQTRARGESYLSLKFDAPQLAEKLQLPPAAEANQGADGFEVSVYADGEVWGGSLSSVRGGYSCPVLRSPARARTRCDDYPGLLTVDESQVREVAVDAAVTKGFKPTQAVAVVRQVGPLEVSWAGGTRGTLHVMVEALDFACVAPAEVPVEVAYQNFRSESGFRVVTPLLFKLRTDDGRLAASLKGFVEARVPEKHKWDGKVEAVGMLTPTQALVRRGEKPGFALSDTALSFLSLVLYAPQGPDFISQLGLQVYQPYPGVPAYPDVSEAANNRASCFGALQLQASKEAHLRPVP
jgi:hypothetical protein